MRSRPADEAKSERDDEGMMGTMRHRDEAMIENEMGSGTIEYVLKIPRSIDPRVASMINERHMQFVNEELRYFSLALKHAEVVTEKRGPPTGSKRKR